MVPCTLIPSLSIAESQEQYEIRLDQAWAKKLTTFLPNYLKNSPSAPMPLRPPKPVPADWCWRNPLHREVHWILQALKVVESCCLFGLMWKNNQKGILWTSLHSERQSILMLQATGNHYKPLPDHSLSWFGRLQGILPLLMFSGCQPAPSGPFPPGSSPAALPPAL